MSGRYWPNHGINRHLCCSLSYASLFQLSSSFLIHIGLGLRRLHRRPLLRASTTSILHDGSMTGDIVDVNLSWACLTLAFRKSLSSGAGAIPGVTKVTKLLLLMYHKAVPDSLLDESASRLRSIRLNRTVLHFPVYQGYFFLRKFCPPPRQVPQPDQRRLGWALFPSST